MGWFRAPDDRRRRYRNATVPCICEVLEERLLLADGITAKPGAQINGAPGVPINNAVVATFTITDSSGQPGSKWNAQIIWGDGQSSKRVPSSPGPSGTFQFIGSHTYDTANTYTITVMIAVPGSHMPNNNTVTLQAVIKNSATLQSIAVTPANPTIAIGTTQQFTATGTYSDSSTKNITNQVTWASANQSVATIANTGVATALATGQSTISATLTGVTGSTKLNVNNATLQSIAVTPANATIPFGSTQQFTATGTFSDHSTQDLTGQVTWASSVTSVATISSTGLATSVAQGHTSISASLRGVTGATDLNIGAPPPQPFKIVGQKLQATVFKTINTFVAYFKQPNTDSTQFHAFVDWGDHSKPSKGHIHAEGNGVYAVLDRHRYVKTGVFTVNVTVGNGVGKKAKVQSLVRVIKR